MSKFISLSALLSALVIATPTFAQECCESNVVHEAPACCTQPAYGYAFESIAPTYVWYSQPMFIDEYVSDEVVMDEGTEIVVNDPVAYEEQLVWTGCNWQIMLVSVPEYQEEQVVYQQGDVHTVGRITYTDGVVEGEISSNVSNDDTAVPTEDSIGDSTKERIDEIQSDVEDDYDVESEDGDTEEGDFEEDEDDDDLADE